MFYMFNVFSRGKKFLLKRLLEDTIISENQLWE